MGEIFPYHSEYFPYAENLELLFFEITNSCGICWQTNHQLEVKMGIYFQNGKGLQSALGARYFCRPFPFFWQIFPHINHKLMK